MWNEMWSRLTCKSTSDEKEKKIAAEITTESFMKKNFKTLSQNFLDALNKGIHMELNVKSLNL